MPCSKLRRTTNMNSIVYNKYPIMIALAGNPHWHCSAQPPPPPLCMAVYIRWTNWINYENHENWVNSFWLNNCLAFVGHPTAAACFFFCYAMSCIPSLIWQALHVLCALYHMLHAACNYNALIKTNEFHAAISCHLM